MFAAMDSHQLRAFVCVVLVCVSPGDARSVRVSNHRRVVEEVGPERWNSIESAQQASALQRAQTLQSLSPLSWRYPEDPKEPVMTPPPDSFEPQRSNIDGRIAVRCGERTLRVEVDQDLFGRGLQPKLGGCSATEVEDFSPIFMFQTELQDCGSTLVMTKDTFIYAFTLVYDPTVRSRSGITRDQTIVIGIECHYPRGGFVSQ